MPTVEFLPLDPRTINVRIFDCGKEAINVYLRRYAAKNMALNLNRTFVLPYTSEDSSEKPQVAGRNRQPGTDGLQKPLKWH